MMEILRNLLINSNVTLLALIHQQFSIKTLKLTSGCPVYHRFVIVVPGMNKRLFGKRLANACSAPVDNVPNGFHGIFLTIFPSVMNEMEWLKKGACRSLI